MARQIYVNLAVKDLDKSVDFFKQLGFEFNPQFSDEKAACMIVNDDAYVMLLVEDYFKQFTRKGVSDAMSQTEAIMALSAESRQEVDEVVNKALAAGGKPSNDPMDQDGMYVCSFQDVDGHLWEIMYMDLSAVG